MSYDAFTDEELVAETVKTKEVFGVLVRRYESKLGRYLKRLGVFRSEDVEDVLQNTFIKAYKNLNAFDPDLKFSSWIYRITHNEAMSFFRSRRVRPEGNQLADSEEALAMLPTKLDLEKQLSSEIGGAKLREALYKLDPKYRDVLILRYFEEREYAEMSDILQLPINTVGTLLNRAKKQLLGIVQDKPFYESFF